MKKLLQFEFLPTSSDLALLLLRIAFGLSMLLIHGWSKLMRYSEISHKFSDPLGVGNYPSYLLALTGEVICSALIVAGCFTRVAALGGMITMGVALFLVHGGHLTGEKNGELAFVYLGIYTALFIAGPGRFSVDGGKA